MFVQHRLVGAETHHHFVDGGNLIAGMNDEVLAGGAGVEGDNFLSGIEMFANAFRHSIEFDELDIVGGG